MRLAEGALVTMLRETLKAFVFSILVVGLGSLGVALGVRAVTNGREPQRRSAADANAALRQRHQPRAWRSRAATSAGPCHPRESGPMST